MRWIWRSNESSTKRYPHHRRGAADRCRAERRSARVRIAVPTARRPRLRGVPAVDRARRNGRGVDPGSVCPCVATLVEFSRRQRVRYVAASTDCQRRIRRTAIAAAVVSPPDEHRRRCRGCGDRTTQSGSGADQHDLDSAIRRLPRGARTVFVLHDVEGWQHDEIASRGGIAVGTSKAHLHRARQLLKEWLST